MTQAVRGRMVGEATSTSTATPGETEPPHRGLGTYSEFFGHENAKASASTTKTPEKNSENCTRVQQTWAELARDANRLQTAREEREKSERLTRWAMLGAAGELRPNEQVARCMTHVQIRQGETVPDHVAVERSADLRAARFARLMPCGSVWDCPICAATKAKQRTDDVRKAGRRHREAGGGVLLVTLTVRHSAATRLGDVLDKFTAAREWLREQRAFKALMARVGCVGSVRALEVTHGEHGWHPHTHELLLTAASVSDQGEERTTPRGMTYTDISPLAQFRADYYRLWKRAARRFGLQINANGLHVRATDQTTTDEEWDAATGYMVESAGYDTRSPAEREQDATQTIRAELDAQRSRAERSAQRAALLEFGGGWDAARELTAGTHKKARTKAGRTPMQLLSDFAIHDDQDAGRLFIEFSTAFKSEKQLVWSRGLKKRLLDDDQPQGEGEQQAEQEAVVWEEWARIPREDWKQVLRAGRATRGELEHHAATDNRPAFDRVIEECRNGTRRTPGPSLRRRQQAKQEAGGTLPPPNPQT